jgi:hypothetical protein
MTNELENFEVDTGQMDILHIRHSVRRRGFWRVKASGADARRLNRYPSIAVARQRCEAIGSGSLSANSRTPRGKIAGNHLFRFGGRTSGILTTPDLVLRRNSPARGVGRLWFDGCAAKSGSILRWSSGARVDHPKKILAFQLLVD